MKKQTFGTMIATLRKEQGMTQLELAEKMGVTDKAVSKWERDLSFPDVNSIPKLAEIFNVSVDELMQVKADAKEVDEETMLNALMFGHEKIKELIAFQEQIVEAVGKEKIDVPLFALDENIVSSVEAMAKEEMIKAISIPGKLERYAAIDELDAKVVESFEDKEYATVEEHDKTIKQVKMVLGDLEKEEVRRLSTEEKVRPDGRKVDEVRP